MATYACSDLHGRLDLLKQIQDFLQPDDTVYFLGDLSILKVITKICW